MGYCLKSRPRIGFTHSRHYEKEDQGHVEQKNYTHVRKIFGWDRYDTLEALEAMNELYRKELRLWQNLYQPSVKLKKKVRNGSRIIRKYDQAKTPFQRVLTCQQADPKKVAELNKLFTTVDPFELSRQIEQKLQRLYRMASQRVGGTIGFKPFQKQALGAPHLKQKGAGDILTPSKKSSPWKHWTFSKKIKKIKTLMRETEVAQAA